MNYIFSSHLLGVSVPTLRTFIGVSVIIGAGIYIYLREKVKDQMIVTDTPNRWEQKIITLKVSCL